MPIEKQQGTGGFLAELRAVGAHLPHKGLFLVLLLAWFALFQFLGNSVLGYFPTPSLFGWLSAVYKSSPDDSLGQFIPIAVLALLWWKRSQLGAIPKDYWWSALPLFVVALLLHVLGYTVQQTRISLVAFFLGLYALTGMVWGWRWMRATFFPFFLFTFMMPLNTYAEAITFPLRLLATRITVFVSESLLAMGVRGDGTRIIDLTDGYQFDVAAECSGIRSLSTMLALTSVVAFISFQRPWKRVLVIFAAFPVALISNVFRLLTIIVAKKNISTSAAMSVHEGFVFSIWPYVPAVICLFLLVRWLGEDAPPEVRFGANPP
jgi:exosortase